MLKAGYLPQNPISNRLPTLKPTLLLAFLSISLCSPSALSDPFGHTSVSYEQPYQPLAISHRGCMFECPENTLAAFAWADRVGADAIEIDLRATADGEVVVIHDKTVNRTTNGRGAIKSLTLAEIRSLDAGAGQHVPTMDEAFAFASENDLRLLLDLKDTRWMAPEDVYTALVRHGITDQVIIGARSVEQLQAFKKLDSDLYSMAFTKRISHIDAYIDAGVDVVRLWARWVQGQPELVTSVHEAGRRVWVTTGTIRGDSLHNILRLGVEGVITDYPQDILHLELPLEMAAAD